MHGYHNVVPFYIVPSKKTELLSIPSIIFVGCRRHTLNSVLQSINFCFFLRVFHAAISVSALISRAEAVISEQENWPFSVKT